VISTRNLDPASETLARRALYVTLSLALASSTSGVLAARVGMVAGPELVLVIISSLFSASSLFVLLFLPKVTLQTVATLTTSFLAANMSAGMLIAVCSDGKHTNLFVFLFWLFPLLVFNKLVNEPAVGRLLAAIVLGGPLFILFCLGPKIRAVLPVEQQVLVGIFCIAYVCFALTLNIITRYREKYIIEQEQLESLKVTSEVFESISDCFISVDSGFRLIYMNDAACAEFSVDRATALNQIIFRAAPGFFSESMLKGLESAATSKVATVFQAHNKDVLRWYDLRCFPRLDGMSIYFRDVTDRKTTEARIEYLAIYDVLTGLPNRQLLRDRLSSALETATRNQTMGALFYIDLDDFKTINDTMGHDTGDALLQQVALRLSACLGPGDTVARIGGDEFVVILEGLSPCPETSAALAHIAEAKMLDAFTAPFSLGTYKSETTGSVGATFFSGVSDTIDDLMKRTDLAMYRAKAEGRNRICFFDPAMQTEVESRAMLRSDLRRALQNSEFELHYQPQLDCDGAVVSAEALLRWRHPRRGMVPPREFIPLAEEAGLIAELGRWVLETACLQLAAWSAHPAMQRLTVGVNVSVRQFLDLHFVSLVTETLRASGANPRRLTLEITESCVMEEVEELIAKMSILKADGVSFSLDDFGTGYSSLSHLRRLPLDQLKIDRSFVNNVLTDAKDASIASSIIALGRSLHLSVIAEGVETKAQRDFLMVEGCNLYQGFLYSPAMPGVKLEAFVKDVMAKDWVPAKARPVFAEYGARDFHPSDAVPSLV
jgi:diguanylate cyclase (GGDEF)-like protein